MTVPADIVNRALDAIGSDRVIGDLEDGTREAQVVLRHYGPCLKQLTRAAHWDTHRKTAPLILLADATGSTPNVGTQVPQPWVYEYEYPIDCMKARFVPLNNGPIAPGAPAGNIALPPNVPLTSATSSPPLNTARNYPQRFTVATDFNYPVQVGNDWEDGAEWWNVQGVGPQERTVILTNVPLASLVYTALLVYPNLWDALFEAAFVAYLAQEIAIPLSKDKKFGLALRREQIEITKQKLQQARVTDGNEGVYTVDHTPDWMRVRTVGPWGNGWGFSDGSGPGCLFGGWDQCAFSDGSCY